MVDEELINIVKQLTEEECRFVIAYCDTLKERREQNEAERDYLNDALDEIWAAEEALVVIEEAHEKLHPLCEDSTYDEKRARQMVSVGLRIFQEALPKAWDNINDYAAMEHKKKIEGG